MSHSNAQYVADGTMPQPSTVERLQGRVNLDDVPLNRFHIKIAGLTFGAHLTEGYVLGTVGYAISAMGNQMPLDPFWMGMLGSSALIGILLGSLLFGRLSDIMGRQKIFLTSFLIITVA